MPIGAPCEISRRLTKGNFEILISTPQRASRRYWFVKLHAAARFAPRWKRHVL
jgi:hypothetical protein